MRSISLRVKISLYLFIVLSAVAVLFTLVFVEHREEELQSEISRHVTQISDVIIASTRNAMLVNERDIAGRIIEDIGKQKGIERVRVINKDGMIIHSNRTSEVGYSVEQQDEPCVQCHKTSTPLKQVSDDKRWKVIEMPGGTEFSVPCKQYATSLRVHPRPATNILPVSRCLALWMSPILSMRLTSREGRIPFT